MDALLAIDMTTGDADLALTNGDLTLDEGLASAITISLFSDARAGADEGLTDPLSSDPHGWWGEAIGRDAIKTDRFGSHLWLTRRAKTTDETMRQIESYVRDALAWLLDDGLVDRFDITVSRERSLVRCRIIATLPGGNQIIHDLTFNRS